MEKWRICIEMWWNYLKIYIYLYIWKMVNLTEQVKEFVRQNLEKWRICMETWRIYKEKWRISIWKNDEFVSWKVKEFIWPNDILCDVNCILCKCFQVQFWGCPGKPKFQFHILCGWSTFYMYMCFWVLYMIILSSLALHVGLITSVQISSTSKKNNDFNFGQSCMGPFLLYPILPRSTEERGSFPFAV